MNYEQILAEVEERGDDYYFTSEFSTALSKLYDLSPLDVDTMVRREVEDILATGEFRGQRNQHAKATQRACLNILGWIKESWNWRTDHTDPKDLAMFVAMHRRACSWAMLVGRTLPKPAERSAQ